MTANGKEAVLGSFYGDDVFPVEWGEGERDLFWIFDDLHIPNPVSPMFFDIGGWWLTCDHMFRRFGTPFASDWIAKNVNGYVYHAAVPADPTLTVESSEYQARYAVRVPRGEWAGGIGAYLGAVLPHYAENFLDWWRDRLRPEIESHFAYLDASLDRDPSLVELAVLLEDAIDIHDRHWKIHWMLNFAQFSATMALSGTIAEVKGDVDPGARRAAAELGRRPELGCDRAALADEGGDQGGRRAVERVLERDRRPRVASARRVGAWSPLCRRTARSASQGVREQGDLVARVRLSDLAREPGAHHRDHSCVPRDGLRLPVDPRGGGGRPRGGEGRASRRGPRGRGARAARARPRALAPDEPAHARPPLLHRSGHERATSVSSSSRSAARSLRRTASTTPRA